MRRRALATVLVAAASTTGAGPGVRGQPVESPPTTTPVETTTTGSLGAPPRAEGGGTPLELDQAVAQGAGVGRDVARAEAIIPAGPDLSVAGAPPVQPVEPVEPSIEQEEAAAALAARLDQAKLGLMVAIGLDVQAAATTTTAEADVASAASALSDMAKRRREAQGALERRRQRMRGWAIQVYTGGSLRRVTYVLESEDINDVPRRLGLASGAFGAVQTDLDEEEAALAATETRYAGLERALAAADERLTTARRQAVTMAAELVLRRNEVAALDAGQAASLGGVAFPIRGPAWFADTFGAPRMTGTRYAHPHQGVDIFAVPGAPVVALERGVVLRLGSDVLGGTKLWLAGQSGTRYYYAHLQGFAPKLTDGQAVEVGQTLGYVGNTGNAARTAHHLHFEAHAPDGAVLNPYAIVAPIAEAARVGAASLEGLAIDASTALGSLRP